LSRLNLGSAVRCEVSRQYRRFRRQYDTPCCFKDPVRAVLQVKTAWRLYKGKAVGSTGVAIRVDTSMTQLCVVATFLYSVPTEAFVVTQFIVC
jgi:hypothetical protein